MRLDFCLHLHLDLSTAPGLFRRSRHAPTPKHPINRRNEGKTEAVQARNKVNWRLYCDPLSRQSLPHPRRLSSKEIWEKSRLLKRLAETYLFPDQTEPSRGQRSSLGFPHRAVQRQVLKDQEFPHLGDPLLRRLRAALVPNPRKTGPFRELQAKNCDGTVL